MFRFARLHHYYYYKALELPLEACARIDAATPVDNNFVHEVSHRYQAKFYGAAKKKAEAETGPRTGAPAGEEMQTA
jgi:hypothetical protein